MLVRGYLLALLVGRKAYREYPAFTAFTAFLTVESLAMFYIGHYAMSLYTTMAWAAYGPQLVFVIMVVMEVFHVVFYPLKTLPKGTLAHFLVATITVAAVAVGFAVWSPGAQPTAWMTFARAMDQATAQVVCGIFAFIALFSGYFGIPWRHRVYGIGIGFLFYLAVDVAVTTVVAQYSLPQYSAVWLLDMLAFLVANVIWTYYFATAEVPRVVPTIEQLNRVHAALGRIAVHLNPQWQDRHWDLQSHSDLSPACGLGPRNAADPEPMVVSVKDVSHV